MIGVIAHPTEHDTVREFFELFKTPWEFYRSDRRYEVLLCAGDGSFDGTTAKLILIYAGEKTPFDDEEKIQLDSQRRNTTISYKGGSIPIYGNTISFRHKGMGLLTEESSQASSVYLDRSNGRVQARIGYDLFDEVRALLTVGQPPANAGIPALELHIALLRDLIIGSGIPLVEIPPVPDGYRFIACLTHDIDHPGIRRHRWDHTMFGFLYRALLGSLIEVLHGQAPLRKLTTNWAAAVKLPLIHLGLAADFWAEFDRYIEIEKDLASTFFVIPFKGDPGRTAWGQAPGRRASSYGASDIEDKIRRLMAAGCEIGLHGLDAWLDCSRGREELEEVSRITGVPDIGVRMHWLYAEEKSPLTLEKAGFSYDSTSGYNETIGYRAGTTQAFKPLVVMELLELPLHVMDTALFYPCHLDLSPKEAEERVSAIIDNALHFGGSVTINWHDRSIAPERLWDKFYLNLLGKLKSEGPWFSTAGKAVEWFRKRRAAVFETVCWERGILRVKVSGDAGGNLPGLRLRVHAAQAQYHVKATAGDAPEGYLDIAFHDSLDTCISI